MRPVKIAPGRRVEIIDGQHTGEQGLIISSRYHRVDEHNGYTVHVVSLETGDIIITRHVEVIG